KRASAAACVRPQEHSRASSACDHATPTVPPTKHGLALLLAMLQQNNNLEEKGPFEADRVSSASQGYDLAKRWSIQQAACRPERVHAADEVEGAQIAVEDFPIIAHLANN